MTLFSILSLIFRVCGFASWADAMWERHEAKIKAQRVADSPKTDEEWTRAGKDKDL